MGTRHLTCVYRDKRYYIAQYGQWDGYPSGQGLTILRFLKTYDSDKFHAQLDTLSWITDDEIRALWKSVGADGTGLVGMDIAEKFAKKWPELYRDTGAKILKIVHDSGVPLKLENSIEFAGSSLFCEWCYVIDYDKNTLEVYEGFNKTKLDSNERFYNIACDKNDVSCIPNYYQVKFKHAFDLDKLPSEELFLRILEPEDEEE